jgi:hypothetical protein
MTRDLIPLEELFAMLVCMPTWEELGAEETTLNLSHTHLFFFSVAGSLGKDSRERTRVSLCARKKWEPPQSLYVAYVRNLSDNMLNML